jgi:5-methyltetrahydrofolate--homocysteine methyltransferase
VVHVLDASRAVGVVNSLLSKELRTGYIAQLQSEYQALRDSHAARSVDKKMLSLQAARENRTPIDWIAYVPPKPAFTGVRTVEPALEELIPFIDWSPFFHTWELRGRYPAILSDPEMGKHATELFNDAQKLLQRIVKEKSIQARGVYGFWPANAVGDDLELYAADDSREQPIAVFHFLRQQMQKPEGQANHSLADFVAPKSSDLPDYLGGFAVTAGIGADELAKQFEAQHDDYNAIMAKALADRLAEAFAEYLHQQARIAWGFGAGENLSKEDLIRERYRGIRPAAGYPASPDHTEKGILFELLQAGEKAGVVLTESFAMHPGASVSGLYFSHPDSKYFGVGRIERDQVEEYALRKGESVAYVEKWLAPNLV